MVVKAEPIPFMKHAFHYGARTAREEALLKGLDASSRQAEMNKAHAGGSKNMITVPQIYTGASSDNQLNKHITELNRKYMEHTENSKFDKLAISNKTGGRKRKIKTKQTKQTKQTKKTKKTKKYTQKTRRNKNKMI